MGGESSTIRRRKIKEVKSDQRWAWLQIGNLKRETESPIVVAQNESIRPNLVKTKIDKSQTDSLCRVSRKVDEIINNIVIVSTELAQKEWR